MASSTARRDADLCAQAVPGGVQVGLLQTAGSAAVLALPAGPTGAAVVAELVRALDLRGWAGDDVLAELLTDLSASSSTGRAPLTVDPDMLRDVLDDPRGGGYLDLTTGNVWPMDLVEDGQVEGLHSDDDDPDPDRWVYVDSDESRAAYQDMVDFTAGLTDTAAQDDLTHALDGRGAFRRFQSALNRHEQHRVHWRVLSTERRTGRARAWLADHGYDAVP